MPTATHGNATLEDLARVDGKAELIAGRIVHFMPAGHKPSRIATRIIRGLDDHAEATGRGEAFTGTIAFTIPELASGRRSFSPDASYHTAPFPADPMQFIAGPPTLAVEVRSEGDHGPAAEAEMAAKRADYFEAGTLVVWDVDPVAELIRKYQADTPERPALFARGQMADAEPAVSGWRLEVDRVFG